MLRHALLCFASFAALGAIPVVSSAQPPVHRVLGDSFVLGLSIGAFAGPARMRFDCDASAGIACDPPPSSEGDLGSQTAGAIEASLALNMIGKEMVWRIGLMSRYLPVGKLDLGPEAQFAFLHEIVFPVHRGWAVSLRAPFGVLVSSPPQSVERARRALVDDCSRTAANNGMTCNTGRQGFGWFGEGNVGLVQSLRSAEVVYRLGFQVADENLAWGVVKLGSKDDPDRWHDTFVRARSYRIVALVGVNL